MTDTGLFILYFFLAGCGILGSCNVLFTILYSFRTITTCSTILVLLLHFSLLAEEITALPYVFKYDDTICTITESFFEYFGLMNIVVIGFIVYAHRWSILNPSIRVSKYVVKAGVGFVLLFPTITFLPFIDRVYIPPESPWCSLPYSTGLHWVLGVYLFWVWMVLVMSLLSSIDLAARLMNTYKGIVESYLTTIGMYTLVSLICWVPRTLIRIVGSDEDDSRFAAYIPIYISGMLYTLIFRHSRKNMELYEMVRQETMDVSNDDLMFLFEERDRLHSIASSETGTDQHLLNEDQRLLKQQFTAAQFQKFYEGNDIKP